MTPAEIESLEQFIAQSFGDGVTRRELRLSLPEVEWMKIRYPDARFKESSAGGYSDGKVWYEVQL